VTTEEKLELIERAGEEARALPDFVLPVHFDLGSALCVIGNLQLALRHPANIGPSSQLLRRVIDSMIGRIEKSLPANAEIARLGDNPEYDTQNVD
jgi:hypothetical protein